MESQISDGIALGRLHDALYPLSRKVHRALANKTKTVWADDRGYVFATRADLLQAISPHTTIGVYGQRTKLCVIESGLRVALRERAQSWIIDWNAKRPLLSDSSNLGASPTKRSAHSGRNRPRRITDPSAPRIGVQPRTVQAGVFHRE